MLPSAGGVALAALVLVAGVSRAADEVHWTITGPTSVSFGWRGCESFVRYGTTTAYGRVAGGTAPSPTPQSSPGPFWEARIGGLRENTRYHYSIGGGPDHTFRTPPGKGASGFTAFVAGDIGDSSHFSRVADLQNLIAAGAPDFVLMVGDLTYGNDKGQAAVDRHFNDVMKWSQDAAYMPAWGNHEWDSAPADDMRNYKGRFDLPHPQTSPEVPVESCCGEDWSWFDYGNTRFIAYPEPYTPAAWADWYPKAQALMDEAQADPAIRFIVTYGHRPAYSSGNHLGSPALATYMGQLGAAHDKYVLDLCGHSHCYERSHPQSGVIHVTSGTGGADLEQESGNCLWGGGCPPPEWSAYRAMHHVAVRLTFTATAIEGTVFCGPPGGATKNVNDVTCVPGDVLDTFTVGTTAPADTFYVDNSSAACSDVGPGSESQPYCTIGAAVAAHAGPGKVVIVRAGTYREQVTIPSSGAPGNPFVVSGEPGAIVDGAEDLSLPGSWLPAGGNVWLAPGVTFAPHQVLVDEARSLAASGSPATLMPGQHLWTGEGLYLNVGGDNPGFHRTFVGRRGFGFVLTGVSHVTVEGFDVRHADDRAIQVQTGCSQVTLRRNTISYSSRFGLRVSGGSGYLIEDNRISDNGDHGISLVSNVTAATLVGNESCRNVRIGATGANGINLYGCPGNVLTGNSLHHNQDSGVEFQAGSNDCQASLNRSWKNGDHGFDQLSSSGVTHDGDVAWGNQRSGFVIQGGSTGSRLSNCISVDNGLGVTQFNLSVDATSTTGFASDANIFWNSNGQPGFKYGTLAKVSMADYRVASGQDARSLETDPMFVNPGIGDLHLTSGSPAIDSGDSDVPGWLDIDAEGFERADDPSIGNSGSGPVAYADRGALEYQPDPPNAALTVTPGGGTAPLLVTLDASASTPVGGSIASYEFDSGDGMFVVAQASPTISHIYPAGTWMATALVTDNVGRVARVTVPVVVSPQVFGPNLVTNPSFETNTSGWIPYSGASLARVPGGLEGGWSLQVSGPPGATFFGINDSPNAVSGITAGTLYRVTAWVSAGRAAGAVKLRVQEFLGGTSVAPRVESPPLLLSCLWQPVSLDYIAQASGSNLDLQLIDVPGAECESFRVDRITAQVVPPATAVAADSTVLRPLAPVLAPNPIVGRGLLRFATSRRGRLRVDLFDLAGRRVRTLLNQEDAAPGERTIAIGAEGMTGRRLGAGLYFYRIQAAEGTVTRKFMLLR